MIEADASGKILSETVETTAYTPYASGPEGSAGDVALDPAAEAPEPAAPPKAARSRRGAGGKPRKAPAKAAEPAPVAGESPATDLPAKGRKRPTRAPARRGKATKAAEPATEVGEAQVATSDAGASAAPALSDVEETKVRILPAPLTPPLRGSRKAPADKHLANDEPVLPEPPRRPRSYRDLDSIPDDID